MDLEEVFEKHKWELNKDEVSNQIATVITKHIGGVNVIYEKHNKEIDELKKEIKQRIKKACEFWLRYKDKPELLVKEYPELKGELRRFGLDVNVIESISSKDSEVWVLAKSYTAFKHFDKEKYQEWLFKLAFREVIKDEI
ncbi:MAG: hypothetical protein DRN14_02565 [Thermoplasmata archaeon]|nr:MAG: hypothetical protein DRN14_02565 [Thermoplasmata archaeon]